MTLERSYPRKISDLFAFLLPFLLLSGLALGGGGVDLFTRHVAGILAWILVAVLLVLPFPERIRPGRSVALIGGLILGLALLSAISSIWSSSVSLSLAEFERGIGYLGFFAASYLTMRTPKQREWFARGIGAGIAAVCLLALGERLIHGGGGEEAVVFNRLNYPLGYWNADGIFFGAGVVLFVWFSSCAEARLPRAGWLALAIPVATALYLTYSRGGLAVASIALFLLFFLSRDRLKVLLVAALVAAASVPILFAVDAYPAISGTGFEKPGVGESLVVILVALASIAAAVLALEALLRFGRNRPELSRKAVSASRDRRFLFSVAGVALATVLTLTVFFGSNVWDQFGDSDVPAPKNPRERFTELSGSYRLEFDEVALRTFTENPLVGTGAGTYRFEWAREREIYVTTLDAHSFFLESLSDLGLAGGLLTFGLTFSLIWLGAVAWRQKRGRDGPVVLAITAALLLSFAFDWFWRLGATAALLLLFAAWIASAEAVEPWRKYSEAGKGTKVAGLLAAWLAIAVLTVPAISDRYIEASADSVREGSIEQAADQARTASRLEPWNPEPHMQLAVIAESRDDTGEAIEEIDRAIELEPENWQARVIRFRINYNAGRKAEARRDYEILGEINPIVFDQVSFREVREGSS